MAAKELVYDAILRRSTDIHLEPKEDEMAVRLRIDGVMYPTEPFDRVTGDAVMNIFKVLGGMDITEKRRAQDGSFGAKLEATDDRLPRRHPGDPYGEKLSLRILDQSSSVNTLAGLGMRKKMQDAARQIVHQPHGLLLSCGPTGAGKSTTLYAALRDVDSYQLNVITVEDPIEYKMANVNQIEINTKAGPDVRRLVAEHPAPGSRRRDDRGNPRCRDGHDRLPGGQHGAYGLLHDPRQRFHHRPLSTAGARCRAVHGGQFPLRRVRASGSFADCAKSAGQSYKPTAKSSNASKFPADRIDQFFRPPGNTPEVCSECNGLGYLGRTGVYELLLINDELRDLIREKAPASKIKLAAKRNGMLTMKQEGIRLLAQGITSVDELERVVK